MNWRILALLAIVPGLTNIFVWLDPILGLVGNSFYLDVSAIPYVIGWKIGPWFWVHYIYCQGIDAICAVLLVRSVARKGSLYRYQSLCILIALAIVYLSEVPVALRLGVYRRYDLTPMLFWLAAAVLWYGIFRHRLLEIVPIARATVLERMANSIVVVNASGRIIDVNEAARAGSFASRGRS